MKRILIIATILLAGCMGRVDKWELDEATRYCTTRGGVDHVELRGDAFAQCGNGAFARILREGTTK